MKTDFLKWFEARFGQRPKIPKELPAKTDNDLLALVKQGREADGVLRMRVDYDATLAACKAGFEAKV